MKCVYCENCGRRLAITRKALPKYGRIIDLVEFHECSEEPVEIDLAPADVPVFAKVAKEGKDKFVQNLNKLQPPSIDTEGFKDRRDVKDVKSESSSSAPRTLLDTVKSMHNTTPVHDMSNEPPTGE